MILALGIERWNLHRRIALNIVSLVGVSPRRMVFGFGMRRFALSMWISNTACTMLMLPIGLAMLRILDDTAVMNAECQQASVVREPWPFHCC